MEFHTLIPQTVELSKKDIMTIPTTIKNKVLMSPGTWNGISYSADEIQKAYENTNWSDKDVISVILDHADKPLSVHDWVGWVKNPKMIGENLIGDIELYDESVLVKLLKAKAKFGVSARVKGLENDDEFRNFTFENFSIVTNPAVKKAFINLSQAQKLKGGKKMVEKQLQEEEVENEDEDTELGEEFKAENEEEELAQKKLKKKKYPYPENKKKSPEMKKKKYPYPYDEEEDIDDEELIQLTQLSDWTDFVSQMKKKYPDMSFKDIAIAFKKKGKETDELEVRSDDELFGLSDKINFILRTRKKIKDEKTPEEKMKEMSEEIKVLKERLDEPDPRSVQELSITNKEKKSIYSTEEAHHSAGTLAMASYLKEFIK